MTDRTPEELDVPETLYKENPRLAYDNLMLATQYVHRQVRHKEKFDEKFIKKVQAKVMNSQPFLDHNGEYRRRNVAVTDRSITPPNFVKVPDLMKQYISILQDKIDRCRFSPQYLPELVNAVAFAHYFIFRIHPWDEGNGRTARLGGDYITQRFDVKSVNIGAHNREDYIKSIEQVHKSGNLSHYELFLATTLKKEYENDQTGKDRTTYDLLAAYIITKRREISGQDRRENFTDISDLMATT